MNEAITVGMVLKVILVVGGIFGLVGLALFILWLLNPFRSGH